MRAKSYFFAGAITALALLINGCRMAGQSDAIQGDATNDAVKHVIKVKWTPNREKAVNTTGGGYRVYYSLTPEFSVTSAAYIDVPYVSGAAAPTGITLASLGEANYYIRVAAYSQLNPAGSDTSAEISAHSISAPLQKPDGSR